jgi:ketosteroid isomerase-like protein
MTDGAPAVELATAYRDAFFARDVDAIIALATPDFVFENVTGGERIEGAEAARGLIAGADHAVAEWTARATHPDTGRRIEWDGIDLIQVRDGRICRNAVYSSAHRARALDSG